MKDQLVKEVKGVFDFQDAYETTCQQMLVAGLEWLEAYPKANPEFCGSPKLFGVISASNADAQALSKAIEAGAGGDCTGAMHQAVIKHCLLIKRNGWIAPSQAAQIQPRNSPRFAPGEGSRKIAGQN